VIAEAVAKYLQATGSPHREPHGAVLSTRPPRKRAQDLVSAPTRRAVTPRRGSRRDILRGLYAYGGYPDIDGLFREQAAEGIRQNARRSCTDPAAHARAWKSARSSLLSGYGPASPSRPRVIPRTPSQLRTRHEVKAHDGKRPPLLAVRPQDLLQHRRGVTRLLSGGALFVALFRSMPRAPVVNVPQVANGVIRRAHAEVSPCRPHVMMPANTTW